MEDQPKYLYSVKGIWYIVPVASITSTHVPTPFDVTCAAIDVDEAIRKTSAYFASDKYRKTEKIKIQSVTMGDIITII